MVRVDDAYWGCVWVHIVCVYRKVRWTERERKILSIIEGRLQQNTLSVCLWHIQISQLHQQHECNLCLLLNVNLHSNLSYVFFFFYIQIQPDTVFLCIHYCLVQSAIKLYRLQTVTTKCDMTSELHSRTQRTTLSFKPCKSSTVCDIQTSVCIVQMKPPGCDVFINELYRCWWEAFVTVGQFPVSVLR